MTRAIEGLKIYNISSTYTYILPSPVNINIDINIDKNSRRS